MIWLLFACTGSSKLPDVIVGDPSGDSVPDSVSESPVDDSVDPDMMQEMRGIWVTRFSWSQQSELEPIFDEIAAAGFNTVFFQVRGNFDAYYDSNYEPWSSRLSGTLGQDPGWDPLAVAIELAHARGLALHAYINTFPMWSGESPPASVGLPHPLQTHPEWLVADQNGTPIALNSSYVFASPGNVDVRAWVATVAADITAHYAVDGIHLDYIRYPGTQYSYDAASAAAYAASGSGDHAAWQREQVTDTARRVYDAVDVPVTAAVWGIYENSFGWSGVSQGNIDYFQDSGAFLEEGVLDADIPMIYWGVTDTPGDRLDFRTLAADHLSRAHGRHVYPGITAEDGLDVAVKCAQAARELGAPGYVLFDWSQGSGWLDDFGAAMHTEPAVPPSMSWR